MRGLLSRLWGWLKPAVVQPDPEVHVIAPIHPAPGLLELWRLESRLDGAVTVHFAAFVDSEEMGRRVSPKWGHGEYRLTTEGGAELASWIVAAERIAA